MRHNLQKKSRVVFLLIFLLSVTTLVFGQSTEKGFNARQSDYILIINSYTESSPWSNNFIMPVYEALQNQNRKLSAYTEHMNMLMIHNEEELNEFETRLFEKYDYRKPALILLLGNPSWALLGQDIRNRWKGVPVILCAEEEYTGPHEAYFKKYAIAENERVSLAEDAKDVFLTVIYTPVFIKETISLMKQMNPEMDTLLFLSDKRYISAQRRMELDKVSRTYFQDIKVKELIAGDILPNELISTLDEAGLKTGILFFSWYQSNMQSGNIVLTSNSYLFISNYTSRPVYTLVDAGVSDAGILGGYFYANNEVGLTVVETIDNVLNGRSQSLIVKPQAASPVFNYLTLQSKGFTQASCPDNTVFYMKPPTAWEQYKNHIIVVVIIVIFVIIFMIIRIGMLSKIRHEQDSKLELMTNYRSLFDNMPIAYLKQKLIYDHTSQIIDYIVEEVNPYFERYFTTRENVIGRKGSEIVETFNEFLGLGRIVLQNKKEITFQYYHRKTDKYFSVILVLSKTEGYMDVFCVDNTELSRAQQMLRTANHKLSLSLEVANITPWKWDLEKRMILCDVNKPVELSSDDHILEETLLSVPDDSYFSKMAKDDRGRVQQAFQNLIDGKVDKIKEEFRVVGKNGNAKHFDWVEAQATVDKRGSDGKPLSLIGSSLVITGRKKLQEDLISAKVKAEESNRLKSAFLANMSHEIRTPLNAIVGFSGILASVEEEEEKREYVNIIENNNTLLLQLIGDILDLSKIEAGTLEFVFSDINLTVLLKEMEQSSRLRIKNNEVQVVFEQDQEAYWINTERNRLTQVMTNMLTNATKFTKSGSIHFGYQIQDNGYMRFYVSDTGCGIPSDKKENIFGRFVKLDDFAQGTGLGLAICKTIVEYMGGEIGVESDLGVGSTFWFTLPHRPVNEKVTLQQDFVQKAVEKNKITVLIAEDNPGNFKLFESILKREYKIIHAWDGEEAVRLFKEENPHIVLMDINMPLMNGYEATKEIRSLSATVPIIAVTAYAFATDEQRIMKSGFDAYAPKPINAKVLKEQMISLLKKRIIFI